MSRSERNFARRIDLTSLQLFVAVCELGSIGRAAEREFLAASAVSKRLADLEAAVETPLLYRHSRELGEYAGGVRGHVRVHANISAIVGFLPEDLGGFARAHPHIKIDLQEHLSGAVQHAVSEGAADLGICHLGPSSTAADLQTRPYRSDRLVLVVPTGHALAARDGVQFSEILDHDIVGLHANSSISLAMRAAAAAVGRTLRQRIQVTGVDAMCRMIDNGLGIGLLPDRAFALLRGVGQLQAVPLLEPWAERTLTLVARDFGALPVTAHLLAQHLAPAAADERNKT